MILLATPKVCSCGREHRFIPDRAHRFVDPAFGGYYWECQCKSTLFKPFPQVTEALPARNTGSPFLISFWLVSASVAFAFWLLIWVIGR